jgi:hypothetical protein
VTFPTSGPSFEPSVGTKLKTPVTVYVSTSPMAAMANAHPSISPKSVNWSS